MHLSLTLSFYCFAFVCLKLYHFFQKAKVPVKVFEFNEKKLANVQSHLVIYCLLNVYYN